MKHKALICAGLFFLAVVGGCNNDKAIHGSGFANGSPSTSIQSQVIAADSNAGVVLRNVDVGKEEVVDVNKTLDDISNSAIAIQ